MQRTPKDYDGISSPAKTIQEMLPEALGRIRQRSGSRPSKVIESWPKIIGLKMAEMARAVSFENGVLTVIVRSSALYSSLCQYEKPRLLAMLQEQFPKTQVRNIVFRIG